MGTSRLTILFDDPFWIGLYEREDDTEKNCCASIRWIEILHSSFLILNFFVSNSSFISGT